MNFLKNIADKAKSVTESPTRTFGNGGSSSPQEGFICPLCLESFDSPVVLQNHFEQKHSDENDIHGPPSPRFGSLGLSPEDARSETPQSDEERTMFSNQVKALEESKTLLANEVMTLRKQLAQRKTDAVPTDRILERANELAAENVGLKAAIDETIGEKQSMEERIKVLEEQVTSRASRDDSTLLRQELVNIQKSMDNSLKEKEKELKSLKETYDELFYEKQQLVDSKEKQDKSLIETQHRLREATEQNSNGNVNKEELEISDILKSEILILKKEVGELKVAKEEETRLLDIKTKDISEMAETMEVDAAVNAQLTEEAKFNKLEIDQLTQMISEENRESDIISKEGESLKKEILAVKKEKIDLEELLQTVQQRGEELRSEKEAMKADTAVKNNKVNELQRSLDEKEKENMRIQQVLLSKEEDITRSSNEKEELLAMIEAGEGVNTAIEQLKAENVIIQEKLEAGKTEGEDREARNRAMIESLNKKIGSQTIDINKEKDEKDEKIIELAATENTLADLQKKLAMMETQLEGVSIKAQTDISQSKDNMIKLEESLNSTTGTLKGMSTEYEKLKISSAKSKEHLKEKEKDLEEIKARLTAETKKSHELENHCTKLKEDLLQEKNVTEKSRSEMIASNERCIDFEAKLKTLEDHNNLNTENIKSLKQAKVLLQDDKLKLETVLEEKTVEIEEAIQKLDSKESRIGQLTSGLTDTEVKVKEMQRVLDDASGKELSLLSDIEQKRKEICDIQEEKASVVVHLESQQSILQRLTNEKDAAEKELRLSKTEMLSLEEKICDLQTSIEKSEKATQEEIGELRKARELLLSQVVDLKNEKERAAGAIEKTVSNHKKAISSLEEKCHTSQLSITTLEMDLANEKADRAADMEGAENEYKALEEKYNSVNVQVESLASEVFTITSNIAGLESERNAALSKTLELEATVGSATEERRGLLERCVAAETETERTRGVTVELRRKLDDAQAALHELGRENQTIQVDLAKQSGRKWKDDTDVVSCTACQAGFSLTNRKHHCRNCGNIFCNDCSNKQANMTGYKKPQRVCEGCFNELGSK